MEKFYRFAILITIISLFSFITACGDDGGSADSDSDTDTDTDSDSDSDSDSDTDADTETDTEAEEACNQTGDFFADTWVGQDNTSLGCVFTTEFPDDQCETDHADLPWEEDSCPINSEVVFVGTGTSVCYSSSTSTICIIYHAASDSIDIVVNDDIADSLIRYQP